MTASQPPVPVHVGGYVIDQGSAPFIIAEIGVNHDGRLAQAVELVEAAHRAERAQAVKFQCFSAEALVTSSAKPAPYQAEAGAPPTQRELLRGLELAPAEFRQLAALSGQLGLAFLGTPFTVEAVQDLAELHVPAFKIASTDLNNLPLIAAVAATDLPILLSTGASELREIDAAVDYLAQQQARNRLIVLHCVSSYPTAPTDAALSTIGFLAQRYGVWGGFSDHTLSAATSAPAVACGACVLEKHLTLDRNLPGPDHSFSLTPEMFAEYVHSAQLAWQMIGEPRQGVAAPEQEVRHSARRSVVTRSLIREGQTLTAELLTLKRPAGGIDPAELDQLVGRQALRDISADTQLHWDMVS